MQFPPVVNVALAPWTEHAARVAPADLAALKHGVAALRVESLRLTKEEFIHRKEHSLDAIDCGRRATAPGSHADR